MIMTHNLLQLYQMAIVALVLSAMFYASNANLHGMQHTVWGHMYSTGTGLAQMALLSEAQERLLWYCHQAQHTHTWAVQAFNLSQMAT